MSIRVGASVKYTDNASRFVKFMDVGLYEAFDIIGFDMEKDIRKSFKDGKGVPSTAPAPPHFQMGKLSGHIAHQVVKHGTGKGDRVLRMGVRKLKYSIIHEIGMKTKRGVYPARPYIRPVVERWISTGKLMKELEKFYGALMPSGKTNRP